MPIPAHMDGKTTDIAKDGFSVMYEFYPKHPKDYPIYHDFNGIYHAELKQRTQI